MRPLHIAFLPLLPSSNAATRIFCERPAEHLTRRGAIALVLPPSGPRAHRLLIRRDGRLRIPLSALYWYGLVAPRRAWQLPRVLRHDVLFIQRGLFRYSSPPVLEGLLALVARGLLGRTIVYHCDDALYAVVPARRFAARFRWADLVLTGNADIAAAARAVGARVELVAGGVDTNSYPTVRSPRVDNTVVLGWAGHAAEEYLAPIAGALARIAQDRRVRLKVVSDARPVIPSIDHLIDFERWSPGRAFEMFADFDIGLMPLTDTPYNRGKEAYKAKEYMAASLPVVCSPVGHALEVVEDRVTGLLAASEDEWVTALMRLCDDAELRARLGAAGRRLVAERYELSVQTERLVDLLVEARSQGRDVAAVTR